MCNHSGSCGTSENTPKPKWLCETCRFFYSSTGFFDQVSGNAEPPDAGCENIPEEHLKFWEGDESEDYIITECSNYQAKCQCYEGDGNRLCDIECKCYCHVGLGMGAKEMAMVEPEPAHHQPPRKILFYLRKEDNGWLSNFERASQGVDGIDYKTNEHFYQTQKAADPRIRHWIMNAPNPHCAMIAGRGLREKEIVKDWNNKKIAIMYKGLLAKFTQNPLLRTKLIETGEATLHEDSETDMFWGILGEDKLGELLMLVREKIKKSDKCPRCGAHSVDYSEEEPMCDYCGWAV